MSKLKLKTALNLTSVFALLIPILVVSLVAVKFTNDYILEMSIERNTQVAENAGNQLEMFFNGPEEFLRLSKEVSLVINREGNHNTDNLINFIGKMNSDHLSFNRFILLNEKGLVIRTYPYLKDQMGLNYSNNEVFQALKDNPDQIKWSSIYLSNLNKENAIDLGVKLDGYILLGTVYVSQLENIITDLQLTGKTSVAIVDEHGVYVAHTNRMLVAQRVTDPIINKIDNDQGDAIYFGESVRYKVIPAAVQGWKVIVYEPYSSLYEARYRFVAILALIMGVSYLGVIAVASRNNSRIEKHFIHLIDNFKQVATGDYKTIAANGIYKEFDDIVLEFNKMIYEIKSREEEIVAHREEMFAMNEELEQRIDDRTNKLIKANIILEKTLEDLKSTQQQLVESEKMASLGSLVAGVAHEINTPIGVTMTAITYLMDEGRQFELKYQTDSLSREDVQEFIDIFSEGSIIIEKNIQKASDLIKSFKLMAVDQSNMDVREFELGAYIKDVLFILEPKIKMAKATLEVVLKEEVYLYGNPGDFSQVMTNLVMNALIHGFSERENGKITIVLQPEKGVVLIEVTDNGVGIDEENVHQIFEPFFTTRRGHGGTGLGLNIVYNLVTQKLKGTIRCVSEVGIGTTFQIRIPYLKENQPITTPLIRNFK